MTWLKETKKSGKVCLVDDYIVPVCEHKRPIQGVSRFRLFDPYEPFVEFGKIGALETPMQRTFVCFGHSTQLLTQQRL